jgi:3',5'-cyclic AMP phosphodiesterase CpdA
MHTGRKHDYLGVDMEFNDDGTLEASMITYLKNVISEFPEMITGKWATPATEHPFYDQRG